MGEDGKGLYGLGKVNHHLVTEIVRRDSWGSYTLDVDATIITADKEEAKVTYKRGKGYQPQMGFLFETGLIEEDEFREGNIPAGASTVSFLKKCFSVLPAGKSINYLRSDSAFYQAEVINLCFEGRMLFTITANQDKRSQGKY